MAAVQIADQTRTKESALMTDEQECCVAAGSLPVVTEKKVPAVRYDMGPGPLQTMWLAFCTGTLLLMAVVMFCQSCARQ